jgi:hypothetical protein
MQLTAVFLLLQRVLRAAPVTLLVFREIPAP